MSPAGEKPLVLIGLMATGKSTVGRRVAVRHGWRFVDTDAVIVDRHGSIAEIFAQRGESGFREVEAGVVAEVLSGADGDTVVSLGGGSVLHERTQELLSRALVAYLDADVATVLPRLEGDTGRPLLAGGAGERWARLDRERRPVYEALADLVINTRDATIDDVVNRLEEQVRRVRPAEGKDHGNDR
ncbi:shikimate kinase [Arthrobacter tecti]